MLPKKTINNQRQLSIDAGVIIRSMHSDCNVSFSKMPLTIKRNNQKNLELQNQKYLKEANNEQCSESEKNCDLPSDLLLEACSRAGVLKKTINNQRQLSIDAGVIIRSMHSDCNVSF